MKSNTEWKYWGQTDPLYGVSSVLGKSKTNEKPWTDEEFYSRGEPDWRDCKHHWEHYGVKRDSCLEVGCGAGRMTRCLQTYFQRVHAIDVSDEMIAYAKRHCEASIVSFHVTDGYRLPLPNNSVTAAFSTIVFQHFHSPEDGASYFGEIHRVLSPDGTIMINLPITIWPAGVLPKALPVLYRGMRYLVDARAALKRLAIKGGPRLLKTRLGRRLGEYMHGVSYEFDWLFLTLSQMGFRDIELRMWYVKSEERYHPFVFARKQ